jgi:hypothetical protein
LDPPDLAFFDVNKTGELAGRLSTDVHEVAEHLVEVRKSKIDSVTSSLLYCLCYVNPNKHTKNENRT